MQIVIDNPGIQLRQAVDIVASVVCGRCKVLEAQDGEWHLGTARLVASKSGLKLTVTLEVFDDDEGVAVQIAAERLLRRQAEQMRMIEEDIVRLCIDLVAGKVNVIDARQAFNLKVWEGRVAEKDRERAADLLRAFMDGSIRGDWMGAVGLFLERAEPLVY